MRQIRNIVFAALVLVAVAAPVSWGQDYNGRQVDFGQDSYSNWNTSLSLDTNADRTGRGYLSVSGGAAFLGDSSSQVLEEVGVPNSIGFDTGYNVQAALGGYVTKSVRLEVEVGYRGANIDAFDVQGATINGVGGDVSTLSFMLNAYYDIPIAKRTSFYIGGGAGVAIIKGDLNGSVTSGGTTYFLASDSDTDAVFAWQVMAGLEYKLSPNVSLTGGYRLWSADDPSFGLGKFDMPMIHSAEIGLRFTF